MGVGGRPCLPIEADDAFRGIIVPFKWGWSLELGEWRRTRQPDERRVRNRCQLGKRRRVQRVGTSVPNSPFFGAPPIGRIF
jgi:hypothetical protein